MFSSLETERYNQRITVTLPPTRMFSRVSSSSEAPAGGFISDTKLHRPSFTQALAALKACRGLKELKRLHAQLLRSGDCHSNVFLATTLVDVYTKSHSFVSALEVFYSMQAHSLVSWNCIILGYADNGEFIPALELFCTVREEIGCKPNHVTFLGALKACIGLVATQEERKPVLALGKSVHAEAVRVLSRLHIFVENSLMTFYSRCGALSEAVLVFERMQEQTAVSWTEIITGCAENGDCESAFEFFTQMQPSCTPSHVTLVAALKACSKKKSSIMEGRAVHSQAARYGLEAHVYVASSLMVMYAECGSMAEALRVFHGTAQPSIVLWNCIINGYVIGEQPESGLRLYQQMQEEDCEPDSATFTAALKACVSLNQSAEDSPRCLNRSKLIHAQAVRRYGGEPELHIFVANSLVDTYSKLKSMSNAWEVFERMPARSLVTWNCVILGYADNGGAEHALELFVRMRKEGVTPNHVTYLAVLKACASLAEMEEASLSEDKRLVKSHALERTKRVHRQLADAGYESHTYVANSLVTVYARCGSLEDARELFESMKCGRDLVSWNCMILGYVESGDGDGELALELYQRMQDEGCEPDEVTYVAALKACSRLSESETGTPRKLVWLEKGRAIHARASSTGLEALYLANSLIDMYSKCGSLADAWKVFESIPARSTVSWNCIILGFAEKGESKRALELFERMYEQGDCPPPDCVTFLAALKACGSLGDSETGKRIHDRVREAGLENDQAVGNSLVDLYGKCGMMSEAKEMFDTMSNRSLVTWNTLLDAYSRQGKLEDVLELFELMREQEVKPNEVSLLCVLTACCHGGLVDKGREYFEDMRREFGVSPSVKHYNCVVDLLGRANRIHEAVEVIQRMEERSYMVWMTLLGACRRWKNVDVGEMAFKNVLVSCDKDSTVASSACVLMSNIYAESGI